MNTLKKFNARVTTAHESIGYTQTVEVDTERDTLLDEIAANMEKTRSWKVERWEVAEVLDNLPVASMTIEDLEALAELTSIVPAEVVNEFCDDFGREYDPTEIDDLRDDVTDRYYGAYESGAAYAREFAHDTGSLENVPGWILTSIDWKSAWNSDLRHDFVEITDETGTLHLFLAH